MKKLWLMLVILVFTVSLLACTKKEDVVEGFPKNDSHDWGIKLSVKDISSKGLTVVFEQSGGSTSSEFLYGEDYKLYVKTENGWTEVPYILEEFGWNTIGYIIEMDSTVEQEIDWTWIYGELEKGTYMLEKEVIASGDEEYEKSYYYVEFKID